MGIAVPEGRLFQLDAAFGDHVDQLHPQLVKLLETKPFTYATKAKSLPESVVYLFSNENGPYYVGRSRKFSQRLGNHCRMGSQPNQASLAYKMACRAVGFRPVGYSKESAWKQALGTVPGLKPAFDVAKTSLCEMQIRYVEEKDDVRQALLEIYCSVALQTPQNTWKTS